MKRIGIDIRCLAEGRKTGVEEYTLNFLQHLFQADKKNKYILFLNSFGKPKADLRWIKEFHNVSLKKFNYPNKILNFLFWYCGWPKIDKLLQGLDFFFLPNIVFGSVGKSVKLIVTMHDLSFKRYPETFSWKRRLWHFLVNAKKICLAADRIMAVSASTKNDLVSLYGETLKEKTQVVYSGVSPEFCVVSRNDAKLLQTKEKYRLPYKFILYFGTIEPRKNIIGIVRAFDQLQKRAHYQKQEELGKYKLVIAGAPGWLNKDIFSEINQSRNRKNILVIKEVGQADRVYLFNLAALFIYPSFFEGFGFPPLEAMKCGVPVIASATSSLPEVVGNGGMLVNSYKPTEMAKAMQEILENKKFREDLIKKGLKQAENFDWDKTVQEFLKMLS
jgi:glycosyltransferase involved in cell wall biosynthesis